MYLFINRLSLIPSNWINSECIEGTNGVTSDQIYTEILLNVPIELKTNV